MTCIGVIPDSPLPGLGLSLLCSAIEQLKVRGANACFVDWVSLPVYKTPVNSRFPIRIGTKNLGSRYSGSTRKVGKRFKFFTFWLSSFMETGWKFFGMRCGAIEDGRMSPLSFFLLYLLFFRWFLVCLIDWGWEVLNLGNLGNTFDAFFSVFVETGGVGD